MAGHRVPGAACPRCGYILTGAFSPFDEAATPRPGDISVCIECCGVSQYTAELELQPVTEVQLLTFSSDERKEIRKAQWAVRKARA